LTGCDLVLEPKDQIDTVRLYKYLVATAHGVHKYVRQSRLCEWVQVNFGLVRDEISSAKAGIANRQRQNLAQAEAGVSNSNLLSKRIRRNANLDYFGT
jgi:hypothetical protein